MIITCPECSARFLVDASALGPEGRVVRCGKCGFSWPQKPDAEEAPNLNPDDTGVAGAIPDPEVEPDTEPEFNPDTEFESGDDIDHDFESPFDSGGEDYEDDVVGDFEDEESDPDIEEDRARRRRERRSGVPALRREPSRWRARLAWAAFAVVVAALVGGGAFYRAQIVATWPAAAQLYELAGFPSDPPGFGLSLANVKFDQSTSAGAKILLVRGEIENVSEQVRNVPDLRGALFDRNEKEIQHWTFQAPVSRLLPGDHTEFRTEVKDPADGAIRLTITFHEKGA